MNDKSIVSDESVANIMDLSLKEVAEARERYGDAFDMMVQSKVKSINDENETDKRLRDAIYDAKKAEEERWHKRWNQ